MEDSKRLDVNHRAWQEEAFLLGSNEKSSTGQKTGRNLKE